MPIFDGGPDNDTLTGGADSDTLRGFQGNDSLDGRGGADRMEGGAGDDIYFVDTEGDEVVELVAEGTDEVRSAIDYSLGANVENLVLSGIAITGIGNSLNNRITGNTFTNILVGNGGSDTLVGGDGDDIYYVHGVVTDTGNGGYAVGELDQTIEGVGGGIDTVFTNYGGSLQSNVENMTLVGVHNLSLFGNELNNVLIGNAGRNFIRGEDGDDYLDGGAGADSLHGGAGNDTYVIDDVLDTIGIESPIEGEIDTVRSSISFSLAFGLENLTLTGGATIDGTGNSRNNIMAGNSAANILLGDGGDDSMDGGLGGDTIDGGFGDDFLHDGGGEDSDLLTGGGGHDVIVATGGNDRLDGGFGNDRLDGGSGNDWLALQGGGDDNAEGGSGNDIFYYGTAFDAGDANNGGSGSDVLALQGAYGGLIFDGDSLASIESLSLISATDIRFGHSGVGDFDYVITTIDANVAAGSRFTVNAALLFQNEDLTFDGSAESDGSFLIYAGRGRDLLIGGMGADLFFFGEDRRFEVHDRVDGGSGNDNLIIRGNYGAIAPIVFAANSFVNIETLTLMTGTDLRFASGGVDYAYDIRMSDGNVTAGQTLTINGGQLTATEVMTLDGSAELDGQYRIFGSAGQDFIRAGQGNDLIYGGRGVDQMTGNGGNDVFLFDDIWGVAESAVGNPDKILDFTSGQDRIDLSLMDADTILAGDQAFTFKSDGLFTGAGQLRAVASGNGTWFVEGDLNGDGVADFQIEVTSPAPLVSTDFIL